MDALAAVPPMAREAAVCAWTQRLTGERRKRTVSMRDWLIDGTVLCKLANAIKPDAVTVVVASPGAKAAVQRSARRTNIGNFRLFVRKLGMPSTAMFDTNDLYDNKDMGRVLFCLYTLATGMDIIFPPAVPCEEAVADAGEAPVAGEERAQELRAPVPECPVVAKSSTARAGANNDMSEDAIVRTTIREERLSELLSDSESDSSDFELVCLPDADDEHVNEAGALACVNDEQHRSEVASEQEEQDTDERADQGVQARSLVWKTDCIAPVVAGTNGDEERLGGGEDAPVADSEGLASDAMPSSAAPSLAEMGSSLATSASAAELAQMAAAPSDRVSKRSAEDTVAEDSRHDHELEVSGEQAEHDWDGQVDQGVQAAGGLVWNAMALGCTAPVATCTDDDEQKVEGGSASLVSDSKCLSSDAMLSSAAPCPIVEMERGQAPSALAAEFGQMAVAPSDCEKTLSEKATAAEYTRHAHDLEMSVEQAEHDSDEQVSQGVQAAGALLRNVVALDCTAPVFARTDRDDDRVGGGEDAPVADSEGLASDAMSSSAAPSLAEMESSLAASASAAELAQMAAALSDRVGKRSAEDMVVEDSRHDHELEVSGEQAEHDSDEPVDPGAMAAGALLQAAGWVVAPAGIVPVVAGTDHDAEDFGGDGDAPVADSECPASDATPPSAAPCLVERGLAAATSAAERAQAAASHSEWVSQPAMAHVVVLDEPDHPSNASSDLAETDSDSPDDNLDPMEGDDCPPMIQRPSLTARYLAELEREQTKSVVKSARGVVPSVCSRVVSTACPSDYRSKVAAAESVTSEDKRDCSLEAVSDQAEEDPALHDIASLAPGEEPAESAVGLGSDGGEECPKMAARPSLTAQYFKQRERDLGKTAVTKRVDTDEALPAQEEGAGNRFVFLQCCSSRKDEFSVLTVANWY